MHTRISKTELLKIVLLSLIAILALVLGFTTFSIDLAILFVKNLGLPLIFTTFAIFALLLARFVWSRRDEIRALCNRQNALVGGLILLVSLFVFLQEPFEYKIIQDELILIATSESMYYDGTVVVPTKANANTGVFIMEASYVDKRPYFHPFLIYLIHLITGYRPENAFVLNILLTPVFLLLVYITGRQMNQKHGGVLSLVLIVSWPLIIQNCNGAHFELLNLVMILGTLQIGLHFSKNPGPLTLALFCYSGILLAQCRYESVMFVFPIALIVLIVWWREKHTLAIPPSLLPAPLLLLTVPLQYRICLAHPMFWQPDVLGDREPFSLAHFIPNINKAFTYLFSISKDHSSSYLLSLLALTSLVLIPFLKRKGYRIRLLKHDSFSIYLFFLITSLGTLILSFCYFWGQLDDPVASRFSLPIIILAAGLVPMMSARFKSRFFIAALAVHAIMLMIHLLPMNPMQYSITFLRHTVIILILVISYYYLVEYRKHSPLIHLGWITGFFIILVSIPITANRYYLQRYWPSAETAMLRQFIKDQSNRNFFITSRSVLLPIIHKVPSAPVRILNENLPSLKLHLLHKNYENLYIYQPGSIDYDTNDFVPEERWKIDDSVVLETVRQIKLSRNSVARISKIVDVTDIPQEELLNRIGPKPEEDDTGNEKSEPLSD